MEYRFVDSVEEYVDASGDDNVTPYFSADTVNHLHAVKGFLEGGKMPHSSRPIVVAPAGVLAATSLEGLGAIEIEETPNWRAELDAHRELQSSVETGGSFRSTTSLEDVGPATEDEPGPQLFQFARGGGQTTAEAPRLMFHAQSAAQVLAYAAWLEDTRHAAAFVSTPADVRHADFADDFSPFHSPGDGNTISAQLVELVAEASVGYDDEFATAVKAIALRRQQAATTEGGMNGTSE